MPAKTLIQPQFLYCAAVALTQLNILILGNGNALIDYFTVKFGICRVSNILLQTRSVYGCLVFISISAVNADVYFKILFKSRITNEIGEVTEFGVLTWNQ